MGGEFFISGLRFFLVRLCDGVVMGGGGFVVLGIVLYV